MFRLETFFPRSRLLSRALTFTCLFILALPCCRPRAWSVDRILLAADGSTTVRLRSATSDREIVFKFGLPGTPPIRMWPENSVLRGLWVTNGLKYTQTVLIAPLNLNDSAPVTSNAVLLVNIHGENTNKDYTEATAELSVNIAGNRQELELSDGLLWRLEDAKRQLLGALEIPDSGVKTSKGKVLRFSGNIPPALQGSMTLKFPLQAITGADAADRLKDIDFDAELRNALKPGTNMAASIAVELMLAEEWKTEK